MEENQEIEQSVPQHAAKWGAILGLISIIITLAFYLIDVTLMVHWSVGLISFIVSLGVLIYSGREYRSKSGGYLAFGKAFLHSFVVLVVASFIGSVFNYLLFNVIDPGLADVLVKQQMDATMQMMESLGGNAEMMDNMEEGIRKGYTLQGQAMGFLWMILLSAIGSLIIGAINKKNPPKDDF